MLTIVDKFDGEQRMHVVSKHLPINYILFKKEKQ